MGCQREREATAKDWSIRRSINVFVFDCKPKKKKMVLFFGKLHVHLFLDLDTHNSNELKHPVVNRMTSHWFSVPQFYSLLLKTKDKEFGNFRK